MKEFTTRDYIVPLEKAKLANYEKKANKAILCLKRFLKKHLRCNDNEIKIMNEVNEFIWKRGKFHIPNKIPITIRNENNVAVVYLQGSKLLKEKPKIKKKEKKEKKEKVKEKEKKEKEEEEKEKKKLEEKRIKEEAEKALTFKKGI